MFAHKNVATIGIVTEGNNAALVLVSWNSSARGVLAMAIVRLEGNVAQMVSVNFPRMYQLPILTTSLTNIAFGIATALKTEGAKKESVYSLH